MMSTVDCISRIVRMTSFSVLARMKKCPMSLNSEEKNQS